VYVDYYVLGGGEFFVFYGEEFGGDDFGG